MQETAKFVQSFKPYKESYKITTPRAFRDCVGGIIESKNKEDFNLQMKVVLAKDNNANCSKLKKKTQKRT